MYTRRLKPFLRALRISGQSGGIFLEPVEQDVSEPWIAHLELLKGEVSSCQVQRKQDGQVLLSSEAAMRWLEQAENLSWRLKDPSQPPLPSPSHFSPPTHSSNSPGAGLDSPTPAQQLEGGMQDKLFFPFRGLSIPQKDPMPQQPPRPTNGKLLSMASWPRESRLVFALIDGHRTREDIARLLRWPLERVTSILGELHARRFIEL